MSDRERATQEDADRLRGVADKLDAIASDLTAVEGGGLIVKFACDLRRRAQGIEERLPAKEVTTECLSSAP